jgi:hypothetical protein
MEGEQEAGVPLLAVTVNHLQLVSSSSSSIGQRALKGPEDNTSLK